MATEIDIGRKRRKPYSHLGQVSLLFLYISFSRLQIHHWQKVESVVSILIIQYSKSSTWVIRSRDFKKYDSIMWFFIFTLNTFHSENIVVNHKITFWMALKLYHLHKYRCISIGELVSATLNCCVNCDFVVNPTLNRWHVTRVSRLRPIISRFIKS